jgi:hypothetical protein
MHWFRSFKRPLGLQNKVITWSRIQKQQYFQVEKLKESHYSKVHGTTLQIVLSVFTQQIFP